MTVVQNGGSSAEGIVTRFLKSAICASSSDLIRELECSGISRVAARKSLERIAKNPLIWRSQALKLSKGERLFALVENRGKDDFLLAVSRALEKSARPGIRRCIAALSDKFILHRIDLLRLLSVPITASENAKRATFEEELSALNEIGFELKNGNTEFEYGVMYDDITNYSEIHEMLDCAMQRLRLQRMIAGILVKELQKQGVVAWSSSVEFRSEKPFDQFGGYVFTGTGYSYLMPLTKRLATRVSPCTVVLDVYEGSISEMIVESFVDRIRRATLNGKRRCLPIIAAREFSESAWSLSKKCGLWSINLRQNFGDPALNAIAQMEQLVSGLWDGNTTENENAFLKFSHSLAELKTHPIVSSLRSIGLEILAGLNLSIRGCQHVHVQKHVPYNQNETREVDAFAIRDQCLYIVECKACHGSKSVTESEVRKFFTETVPAVKSWLRTNQAVFCFDRCIAEIWTTGNRGKAADTALRELSRPKNDEWNILNRKDIENALAPSIKQRGIELVGSISKPFEHESKTIPLNSIEFTNGSESETWNEGSIAF